MSVLRRRLRLWVTAWLLVQVASLSAFVPRDCCARCRSAAEQPEQDDHEPAPATGSPVRDTDEPPCPMHRNAVSQDEQKQAADECVLRGACCDGTVEAIFPLLTYQGILPESVAALPRADVRRAGRAVHERVAGRLESPDPPPPRA